MIMGTRRPRMTYKVSADAIGADKSSSAGRNDVRSRLKALQPSPHYNQLFYGTALSEQGPSSFTHVSPAQLSTTISLKPSPLPVLVINCVTTFVRSCPAICISISLPFMSYSIRIIFLPSLSEYPSRMS